MVLTLGAEGGVPLGVPPFVISGSVLISPIAMHVHVTIFVMGVSPLVVGSFASFLANDVRSQARWHLRFLTQEVFNDISVATKTSIE